MKDLRKMIYLMEKEYIFIVKGIDTKEILKMVSLKEKGYTIIKMEENMKEI